MSEGDRYPVPASTARIVQVIERSRFIATVGPAASVEEATAFVRAVSEEHADATHNCWAYVVGPPGSTGRIGLSDDGEPHGTAGRPMLTVLLHGGVGDVAAVVTRYYGGVKLGTGGLARAYAGAVKEALERMPRTDRVTWMPLVIGVDYAAVNAMRLLFPRYEAVVDDEAYADAVTYHVRVPASRRAELLVAVRDATNGRAVIREPASDAE